MLSGDNSILSRATEAKRISKTSNIQERIRIAKTAAIVETNGILDYDVLKTELAKEFGIEGTDWNITNKATDPWIITIENEEYSIEQSKGYVVTASDISNIEFSVTEKKTEFFQKLYGSVVTNYDKIIDTSLNDEWKIFYIGTMGDETESHIYLISDSYVKYSSLPSKTISNKTYSFMQGDNEWKANFANYKANSVDINDGILPAYSTGAILESTYATINNIKNLNYSFYNLGYTGENQENMRAVAAMLDTNIWSTFLDSKGKAKYAIGGPTIEMFMKSYNDSHGTDYGAKASSETGYQVSKTATSDTGWANNIDGISRDDTNKLYISENVNDNAISYWIASPSARGNTRIIGVDYRGYLGNSTYDDNVYYGFRPIVCLNSNIELEKQENGTYIIK